MKLKLLFSLSLLIYAGCAKERPVEKKSDINDPRWNKSVFLQPGASGDTTQLNLTGGNNAVRWLTKVTMVKTSSASGIGFVGLQNTVKLGFFEFGKDNLYFYNSLSVYGNEDDTQRELINSWKIEHSEYRLAESGGKVTNKEEENDYLNWQEKRFFRIKFAEMSVATDWADSACWSKTATNLVDGTEVITPEHIGFTIAVTYTLKEDCFDYDHIRRLLNDDMTNTIHLRYSFIPQKQSAYVPYKYAGEEDPLNMKFGYFKTQVEKIDENHRLQNQFLMNRWDPSVDHTIYFAPGFPEAEKWVYADPEVGIIAKTNSLLERNGLSMRFKVEDAPEGVTFGDLGKSFFKYIDEIDEGSPLGYGPSDADPLTGEIISSNSMVWTGYLGYYLQRIADEFAKDKTRYVRSTLYQKMKSLLNNASNTDADATGSYMQDWTKTATELKEQKEAYDIFNFLLPQFTYGLPGNLYAYKPMHAIKNDEMFVADLDRNFFNVSALSRTQKLMEDGLYPEFSKVLPQAEAHMKSYLNSAVQMRQDYHQSTIFEMDKPLAMAVEGIIAGEDPAQMLKTIVFRVAIHEFGHNLGLRHNFYGSVDEKHFATPIPALDDQGNQIMETHTNELGEEVMTPKVYAQNSSSVMDYADLTDEVHDRWDWEAYDEAALAYAYSNGEIDYTRKLNTTYLYCTDEHRVFNAMCGAWDRGTTPSEVALSLIKRYEANYWIRNYRYGRAYWNSIGYPTAIANDMWALKKFLKFMENAYDNDEIRKKLVDSQWKDFDDKHIDQITRTIRRDFKQAVRLGAAFYHGVIQQSFVDRPWTDVYSEWSGALQRKGILWDKLYAMYFLMGDDGFIYNINNAVSPSTYLLYLNDGDIGDTISKIVEQSLLRHIDMEQGFNSFARILYAINAYDYRTRTNATLIDKLKFTCFTPASLKAQLGIDPNAFQRAPDVAPENLDTAVLDLDLRGMGSVDSYFSSTREKIGVTKIYDNYFVALQNKNQYAFDLIEAITNTSLSVVTDKAEMNELYSIYNLIVSGRIPECR